MNNKFDELAKGLAQSVTRRQAFKRFGVGVTAMALACFGLANKAEARGKACFKKCVDNCVDNGGYLVLCESYCGFVCFPFRNGGSASAPVPPANPQ